MRCPRNNKPRWESQDASNDHGRIRTYNFRFWIRIVLMLPRPRIPLARIRTYHDRMLAASIRNPRIELSENVGLTANEVVIQIDLLWKDRVILFSYDSTLKSKCTVGSDRVAFFKIVRWTGESDVLTTEEWEPAHCRIPHC